MKCKEVGGTLFKVRRPLWLSELCRIMLCGFVQYVRVFCAICGILGGNIGEGRT